MRQIQYNTFGKTVQDNMLVDFLNTLREGETDTQLAENIQTSVMKFMHKINQDMIQFPIKSTPMDIRKLYGLPKYHKTARYFVDLYVRDVKERIQKHDNWRHQLRCLVWGAVKKKFHLYGII